MPLPIDQLKKTAKITNLSPVNVTANVSSADSDITMVTLEAVSRGRSTAPNANNIVERVQFVIQPAVEESSSAGYAAVDTKHMPGSLQVYTGSSLRTFGLSARLPARTIAEAREKLRIVNLIRGWTKPYFGTGNAASFSGAPPDVLLFTAYGPQNIYKVPVAIDSYSIPWPTDTDYVTVSGTLGQQSTRVPILSDLQIALREVRSMNELNDFDLAAYKSGTLDQSW